jgi:hypothetical protein
MIIPSAGHKRRSSKLVVCVAKSGNNLTVNLPLAFNAACTGVKNVYLFADDLEALNTSGWQLKGTYSAGTPTAPRAVSVTPASGIGSGATFVAQFSDVNGNGDIRRARAIINEVANAVTACDVIYYPGSNTLALYQDRAWSPAVTLGSTTTLTNNRCTVNLGTSNAVRSGNNLTLKLVVSFNAAWTGSKNIYLFADDLEGLNTGGWQLKGTYTVAP